MAFTYLFFFFFLAICLICMLNDLRLSSSCGCIILLLIDYLQFSVLSIPYHSKVLYVRCDIFSFLLGSDERFKAFPPRIHARS